MIEAGWIRPKDQDVTLVAFHAAVCCGRLEVCVALLGFGFWVEL